MKRKPTNLKYHELIGLKVKILRGLDSSLEGLEGIVLWETTRSFILQRLDNGRRITILKAGSIFCFELYDRKVEIMGEDLLGNPADRAKKLFRVLSRY